MKTKIYPLEQLRTMDESQLNAIVGDVDLKSLNLSLKGYASELIIEAVTAAIVERTIEGASTLTITALDRDRVLCNSPYLVEDCYTQIDGLWFALVGVEKSGDYITLVWEDREVYILRKYNKPKTAAWGKTTRARFIRDMVREVKEVNIDFICPELGFVKKTGVKASDVDYRGAVTDAHDRQRGPVTDAHERQNRRPGLPPNADVKVKNKKADAEQREMITRVLNKGLDMGVKRKLLISSIMAITVESTARNLDHGHLDSVGLFQMRPSQGWGTKEQCMNPEYASHKFFTNAKYIDDKDPTASYAEICQRVLNGPPASEYQQWLTEAQNTVKVFGIEGGDTETQEAQQAANNQDILVADDGTLFLGGAAGADYQFTRGSFSKSVTGKKTVKKENTWVASGRLAEEVNWRRFMINGDFYYMSEPYLFKSQPRMVIKDEYDEGIIGLDFNYDKGRSAASVTITAFTERWAAPPGSIVVIEDIGVIRGRWLVTTISRSLFNSMATITLKKPRPVLPEPQQAQELGEDITPVYKETPEYSTGYKAPLESDGNLDVSEFNTPDGCEGVPGAPPSVGRYCITKNSFMVHGAKDWFAPPEASVMSPIGGAIIEWTPGTGAATGQVFGGVVKLQQDDGKVWVFRHVTPGDHKVGAHVLQGVVIAQLYPGASHCHIEVWKSLEGGYTYSNMLDPVKVLQGGP